MLIEQHVTTGSLQPLNLVHASLVLLMPQPDPNNLPRWVNDYQVLNANTVLDAFLLPWVDDILADCPQVTIWSVFRYDIGFPDINEARGHMEDGSDDTIWIVMPMGLWNVPPIHQCHVTAALQHLIGKICHMYVDDVVIWLRSVTDHTQDVCLVLGVLCEVGLYLNPKKCQFYCTEINFLGHHIPARGIEANTSKADRIQDWPVPKSATDICSFLRLVQYILIYLPNLAEYTCILTPLTMKAAKAEFPVWTDAHQKVFQDIKELVTSRECLTVIDHINLGDNKIFVPCDASDWHTGVVLSFGPTWEMVQPVTFDLRQLKGAESHYPVHKKRIAGNCVSTEKVAFRLTGMDIYCIHRP